MPRLNLDPVPRPDKMADYWKKEWKLLFIVALSGLIFDGSMSFVPVLQGRLIDAVVDGTDALCPALYFVCAVLTIQLFRFIKRYSVRVFANRTSATMRRSLYHNLLCGGDALLSGESAGEIIVKAVSDVDITVEGMRKVTTEVFDTGVLMLSYFIMLLTYDVPLTAACCVFVPLAMWIAERLKGRIERYTKAARAAAGAASETARVNTVHALLYRVEGVSEIQTAAYKEKLDDLYEKSVRSNLFENSMQPVYYAVSMLGMAAIFFFGGRKAVSGEWSIGSFTAYVTLFTALAAKASKAAKLFNTYQKATVSWKRIKPYLAGYPPLPGEPKEAPGDTLTVEGLSMRYENAEKDTLENVSFTARAGEIVGVTGPVASGKTTLALALCGLVPYTGTAILGDRALRSLTPEERAGTVAYMGHAAELFSDTKAENVSLGRDGDVLAALRAADFDKDLAAMPHGLDTPVGNGGLTLSGGQQQRIALARALYSVGKLLILDDPFASVDTDTEKAILENLRAQYSDRIILLISHRLNLFPSLENILLLDGTGHASVGTHEALLEASPLYRQLIAAQEGGDAK